MTFIDGSRITPGTEKCKCDTTEPLPNGQRRECEFPCWQRIGMTSSPCCVDCPPLPDPESFVVIESQQRGPLHVGGER